MQLIIVIIMVGITLLAVSLERTYRSIPLKELKRRARRGDEVAALLFRAVSYGGSLRAVLWFLIGISAAGFFLAVDRALPTWLALLLSATLIWIGFVWLPAGQATKTGEAVAARMAPVFAWLLNYLQPILGRIITFVRNHRPVTVHTGLYERADLLDLLDRQLVTTDNRIQAEELELVRHALTFSDRIVRDHMVPRRVVKMVPLEESVGPKLMDELHKSGHSRYPVFDNEPDKIVGTLFMRDLIKAKKGGSVRDVMREEVVYVHEDQPLWDALQAVLKTRHHLLVVVNGFEEFVGIITAEDVLEQIIGRPMMDEFDLYDDLRSVAARAAAKEHAKHVDETPVQSDETVVESK